ncbi:MAG: hypothetical protein WEB67_09065 [Acidimicrobiia bacterium]
MGDGLFSNAMKVSVPVDIVRYRRLTSIGYAAAIVLLLVGASVGADWGVLFILFLVPVLFVWITIARRFTALGKNPAWMLLAWPLSTIIWLLLFFIPAAIDGEAAPETPPGMPNRLSPRSIFRWVGLVFVGYIVVIVVVALVTSS